MSVRRKRLTLFAVAAVLLVGLFALYHYQTQYVPTPDPSQPLDNSELSQSANLIAPNRAEGRDSVRFVRPTGGIGRPKIYKVPPTSSYSYVEPGFADVDISNFEQPSRDDIGRRRQHINFEANDHVS
ncbi:uncharacterized protein LOC113387815 [Ctenocephalides felis]|uniref:uncharacterized protein LOC113387815 n=1 Tax=Ctenocephalides felis TaxID=7515 RepID=UPI000E6E180A|nr:uncharacterized protein LOC113387815 [Ctenocephalides felis]